MSQMQFAREERVGDLGDSLTMATSQSAPLSNDINVLTSEMMRLYHNPDEYWYTIGSRLLKIVNGKLYREGGYHSFSNYCRTVLGYSRQHAYKLIKVVNFVNRLQLQANTAEKRTQVSRLTRLGFTKLYMLQSLPEKKMHELLSEGVMVGDSDESMRISMEELKIGQLKSVLADQPIAELPRLHNSLAVQQLRKQAENLKELIAGCRNDLRRLGVCADLNKNLDGIEQAAAKLAHDLDEL